MENPRKNAEICGKMPKNQGKNSKFDSKTAQIQAKTSANSSQNSKFSTNLDKNSHEKPKFQVNSSQNSQKFNGFFEIHNGALDVPSIYSSWFERLRGENLGAFITFCGIVRAENGVSALHFDICDELLGAWFEKWCKKVAPHKAWLCFAHARGEVKIHQSSYFAGVASKQRKLALALISDFVEDFKANAPIWKYDVKNGAKIYALERSTKLGGAGLLG